MRPTRCAVITGLGVVAPNGIGKQAFWASLMAGKSAVDWVHSFDPTRYRCKVAAEIREFRLRDFMPSRTANRLGRFSQLALASAHLAVRDAQISIPLSHNRERVGVCFGTAVGGNGDIGERNHRNFLEFGAARINPLAMVEASAHAATSHIAKELGASGAGTSVASGCTAGLDAVLWGTSAIRTGHLDVAIVGASDAPITEFLFSLFSAGRFLSSWTGPPDKASRPYDLRRSGLALAEGAATIALEDRDHAVSRGDTSIARLPGPVGASEAGFTGSARSVYARGLERALLEALTDAGYAPRDIEHIHSHGNSTRNDDAAETQAYKDVFGPTRLAPIDCLHKGRDRAAVGGWGRPAASQPRARVPPSTPPPNS